MSTRKRRTRQGFTLIEVLLVLAILIILGSIVVFNFSNVFEVSKTNAAQAQIDAFETQLDLYLLDVGSYPSTSQGLVSLRQPPGDLANAGKWRGPYAKEDIPADPWGHPYQYELLSGSSYRIWSLGPDGQDGTEDDISNISG